jgi:predicted double-glycine peptidase
METFEIIPAEPQYIIASLGFESKVNKTEFESINNPVNNGFPYVKEIVSNKVIVSCAKDPVFDRPLSELEKEY